MSGVEWRRMKKRMRVSMSLLVWSCHTYLMLEYVTRME